MAWVTRSAAGPLASVSSSSRGSLDTFRVTRLVVDFRDDPDPFPSFLVVVLVLVLVLSDEALRFLVSGWASFVSFDDLTFLTAKGMAGLVARTFVLRFFDAVVVPARSPVTGLTFSLSTGTSSFKVEDPWRTLFKRADERVAMMLEFTGLALTGSAEGASWKTVKVREAIC